MDMDSKKQNGDIIFLDPTWTYQNKEEVYTCSLCGEEMALKYSPNHGCIVRYSNQPGQIFLAAHNTSSGWKAFFPLRDAYKALMYREKKKFNIRKIDDISAVKRFLYVGSSTRDNSNQLLIDEDYLKQLDESVEDDRIGRHCCGVCGELCWRPDMPSHSCILEHTSDPQCRFLVMPNLNAFYPVVEGGTHILIGGEADGEPIKFSLPLEDYKEDDKIFVVIDNDYVPRSEHKEKSSTKSGKTSRVEDSGKSKKKTSTTIKFSTEEDVKLIREIELRPAIWNYTLPSLQRTDEATSVLWNEVAEKFSATPEKSVLVLKNRWRNIKTARDKRNAENEKKIHSGAKRHDLKPYHYEENMQFLRNVDLSSRTTTSNIPKRATKPNSERSSADREEFRDIDDDEENGTENHNADKSYTRKRSKQRSVAESLNTVAEAMSTPININFPPMPAMPMPPAPLISPSTEMSDTMIWALNAERNLRRLTPRKRNRLMDEFEEDLRKNVKAQSEE